MSNLTFNAIDVETANAATRLRHLGNQNAIHPRYTNPYACGGQPHRSTGPRRRGYVNASRLLTLIHAADEVLLREGQRLIVNAPYGL